MMEDELLEKIVRVLETQKAFIVIDDIWREGDWDQIKDVFLPRKVALHADKQCATFKPECLTFEDSWDLFQWIAFPIKDTTEFKIEEDMKEIGMEMLKHCGGLPLAIKVLGGLVCKKYTLNQWKMIQENIKTRIIRGTGSDDRNVNMKVYDVLNLSFEELSAYLKQSGDTVLLLAAEGILMRMDFDGASIREVADGYLEELVKRNMVISERDVKTFRFETLQLHDMMRENFVQIIRKSTANSKSPCESRRLAFVRWYGETFNVDTEVKKPSLRALFFIKDGELKATSLFFTRHKLMRVLDLSWVKFEEGKVPSSIGKLIHLRYLIVKCNSTSFFYAESQAAALFKLKCISAISVYIPNIFKEMRELTFLWLPERLHDKTKFELGNLVKLETLKNFCTKYGRVTDLQVGRKAIFKRRLMAEALLPFAVERLWNLLVRETGRFQGVEEQFEGLKNDVEKLRCFLEDAEAKKHTSATVKRTIKAIKEIVLDAEDIVETFVLMEELGNRRGITNTVRRFSCFSLERRGLAMDMKAVRERISKEIHDMQSYGVQQQVIVRERCMPPQDEQRQTFYIVDEEQPIMMEGELREKIVRVLETQKALIVIDDIWREGDWDLIKHVFLPKKVALHADKQCATFKPECLTFEDSWDLFQRIAFPIKDTTKFKIEEDMKEIGMEMLKHCGGLPLAIKVLGGLLGKKYALHEWKRIYESINSNMVGGFEDVFHVLCLSFEELPVYLKHCFLYLAHFPEDYKISVEKLSYYWAAERIPRTRYYDRASIREVADGYIEELVKRNMVISKRDVDTSRFETLQLHDMMREVCLRKAEEENFVQTIGTSTANSKSSCKSRRLAVVHLPEETFNVDTEMKNPSLRSLLFIEGRRWKATSLFFTRHKLMRVLDLFCVEFEGGKVPSSIGKLIHLRYLSFEWSTATQLPSSMRNLKKLFYLNLAFCDLDKIYMPNKILNEMRELTFLCLPKRLHDKTKLELRNLVKLEKLKNFSTKHGRVMDLKDERYTIETLSSSLSKLSHLESLTIHNHDGFYTPTNDDEEGFVWDFVNLKQLWLEIYMPRLPDAQRFPSHLTTIDLSGCRLTEDPMPILEKLLHLKEIRLWSKFFCGRRMVCSRDGFPQLEKLGFWGLEEWEEWIIEEGSMPLLHTLEIESCPKLKELPDGLRFVTNLGGCHLTEDPMPILEKLLLLKEVRLKSKSFCVRRMVCSRDGFPQLQKLKFSGLKEWEEWIIEEGSMPLLHTLSIRSCIKFKEFPDGLRFVTSLHDLIEWEEWIVEEGSMSLLHNLKIISCPKLKEIPDGLRFITSLKSLTFYNMGKRWEKRLANGGKDYYKFQHIPSVII
ncbi:LOW QUALITY PROTEIN: hypothetical protein HID58_049664 [Brassica napus]|uniref:NB-ARC domain-containing protein n=1 Tax=Brassica napus TaxID=3708 RepID=A0ABQ8B767_BRANA|nr:LOW QUALITY PROTEIN: hypothetical protein HID58_049664 [Brassica napus]